MWHASRSLSKAIWGITTKGSFTTDFGLKDQINASSGSTMDNIAEGFGRGGNKEFISFLSYARASNNEVQSQLYRALDRNHIGVDQFKILIKSSIEVGVKINNLMNYLRRSKIRGEKFRP